MFRNLVVFIVSFCLALAVVSLITEREASRYVAFPEAAEGPVETKNVELLTPTYEETSLTDPAQTAPRFWRAGVKTDREVVDLFAKFREAVARGDKKTVASLMDYPMRVNFPQDPDSRGYTFIKNRQSFVRLYNRIFDEKLRTFISDVDPESEDIWAKSDGIAVGRGVIWIGAFCNDRKCSTYHLAFRTIHGNSHLMDFK